MNQRFNYLDFLSPHNRLKPHFSALAEAVLSQANDLFALLSSLPSAWSLDEAVGVQLDDIGALMNIPRPPNASDEEYRLYLRARIAGKNWDGTNESLPGVLANAFPGRTAQMIDNMDGTVTVSLSREAPPFALEELFPIPAGVRMWDRAR